VIHNLRLGFGTNAVPELADGWRGSVAVRSTGRFGAFAQQFLVGRPGDILMAHRAYPAAQWGAAAPLVDTIYVPWVEQRWQAIRGRRPDDAFREAVRRSDASAEVRFLDWDGALGPIDSDAYLLVTSLPASIRPQDVLAQIRDDPNGINPDSHMHWYAEFPPGTKSYGEVANLQLHLKIAGITAVWDNGAIAFQDADIEDGNEAEVCAITLENEESKRHPVAGMRCWGFFVDGAFTIFYTVGMDRWTNRPDAWPLPVPNAPPGRPLQQNTWTNLMQDVAYLVRENGGTVDRLLSTRVEQPLEVIDDAGTVVAPSSLRGIVLGD
jgi:hypothetical protein